MPSPRRPLPRAVAVLAVLAAALLAVPAGRAAAQAAATTVAGTSGARAHDVDRAHSEINFVAASRLLDAHGHFARWSADVQLDPEQLERSRVAITIDAASIDTRVERRDTHLRSADFLDVARHPTITFVSKAITRTSPTAGVIAGELTMRGVTRPVEVPVTLVFYENGRGRFRGQFTVRRGEYGVSYSSRMNPIDDEVQVQFNLSVMERKG